MDEVTIGHTNYRGTFVSMGNPHFINFINGVEEYDVQTNGVRLEQAKIFPERCNIEFAEIRPDGSIRMRVWERGSGHHDGLRDGGLRHGRSGQH